MFHLELDAGGIQRGHKSLSLVSLTCNIVGGSNHKPKTTQDNHRARHTHYDAAPHPPELILNRLLRHVQGFEHSHRLT